MDRQFVVNSPSVVSEVIDGEVVIMNLTSGNYYSSEQTGAAIWGWIEEGRSLEAIARLVSERYDVGPEDVAAALTTFVDRLIEEKLVREVTAAAPLAAEAGETARTPLTRERFVSPQLQVYSDMQDLLLLDPIHDVDDTGWPQPKSDAIPS